MRKEYKFYDESIDNGNVQCDTDCVHYSTVDVMVYGYGSGCYNENIYDEDGELSDESNDEIIVCMDNPKHCILFKQK